MEAWMRVLRITLSTKNTAGGKVWRKVIEDNDNGVGLNISISGDKYMSTLKDACSIKISNLNYADIIEIVAGKFYNVKIECGYKSTSTFTIFDGGVMYITNLRESVETNTVTILCASHLVATYGQQRMNLSFNSGLNLYSVINFICKAGGITNPNVSTQFKKKIIEDIENCDTQNVADWIAGKVRENGSYITSSDCIGNSYLTMFDASKSDCRVIPLNVENMIFTNGFPKMTTEGVTFSVLPIFQFQCGDTLRIDNSIIQIDVQSQSDVTKNFAALLDQDGLYIVMQMHYELQNRGNDFYIQMNAKTRSRISAYLQRSSRK